MNPIIGAAIAAVWIMCMAVFWAFQPSNPFDRARVTSRESSGVIEGVILLPRTFAPKGGVSIGGGLKAY